MISPTTLHSIEDVLSVDIEGKNVLIIGSPASGKTFVAAQLKRINNHHIEHTDDYISYGYQQSLYAILESLTHLKGHHIVEGVQGYRMLRKGAELASYKPDIVIECVISRAKMEAVYRQERDPKKIKYLRQFNLNHLKILNDYYGMVPKEKLPVWITFENNY